METAIVSSYNAMTIKNFEVTILKLVLHYLCFCPFKITPLIKFLFYENPSNDKGDIYYQNLLSKFYVSEHEKPNEKCSRQGKHAKFLNNDVVMM